MSELSVYDKLGREIGSILNKKQKAYGNSFEGSGEILKQLYPDGVPPTAYTEMLAIVRIIDKLYRVASLSLRPDKADLFDESPGMDIAGYGILLAKMHNVNSDRKG